MDVYGSMHHDMDLYLYGTIVRLYIDSRSLIYTLWLLYPLCRLGTPPVSIHAQILKSYHASM